MVHCNPSYKDSSGRDQEAIYSGQPIKNVISLPGWHHSKWWMCCLQNLVCDYQENVTTGQTEGQTDGCWTKWSLCDLMLRRQNKNTKLLLLTNDMASGLLNLSYRLMTGELLMCGVLQQATSHIQGLTVDTEMLKKK